MRYLLSPLLLRLVLPFMLCQTAHAQTTIGGIINRFSPVTDIDRCLNMLTVDSPQNFLPGQTVLLIQMKGAEVSLQDNITYGEIISFAESGNYEENTVKVVSGSHVYLKYALLRNYNPAGRLQLVTVPVYNNVSITSPLTTQNWNGRCGGVLVFKANNVVLNDSVDVSGKGFNGGQKVVSALCFNSNGGATNFRCDSLSECGAMKGEGIAEDGFNYGRGHLANGGGGGNDHNAGGGGGSNVNIGGFGGQRSQVTQFQCSGPGFGFGGVALAVAYGFNKTYMGGGGGAGDDNNDEGSGGKNGGGIILIRANSLTSNGFSIRSDGIHQHYVCDNDGAGGGGAGGTVMLDVSTFTDNLFVSTTGGDGGSLNTHSPDYCMGPGGGGSGGMVWVAGNTWPSNMSFDLQGGVNGINVYALNPDCPYGTTNGALPGFLGDTMLNLQVPVATDSFIPLQSWASDDTIICPGETVVLSAGGVSTYGPNIVWSTGETGTSISITPQQTTFVIVSISDHNLCLDNYNMQILVSVPVVVVTANPDTAITPPATVQLNCNTQPGWTYLWAPPTGLSNPTIANPVASPLQTTTYCVTVTDSSGCTASACITVEVTFVPDVDTLLDIDIANTFTPNGDGANDFFTLFGKNVASFSFQIFNRWGQLVYETQQLADLNDLSKGWNGTYRGADQSAGVYVWQLKATGTHGGELKQHGDLLLLR